MIIGCSLILGSSIKKEAARNRSIATIHFACPPCIAGSINDVFDQKLDPYVSVL